MKTALNIVCFPEQMDLNILGKIMQGGAEKVIEAGGTLAGGHSIMDNDVKYGLQLRAVISNTVRIILTPDILWVKSIGPGRYREIPAIMSSRLCGFSSFMKFFMPALSSWNTPSVFPVPRESSTALSS